MKDVCQNLAAAHHVVVFEGCDGTGKTIFVNYLASHHGFRLVHFS